MPTQRIRVRHDQDAESPRDWDNIGTMACKHSRYSLGDEGAEPIGWYDLSDKDTIAVFNELPTPTQNEMREYMDEDSSCAEVIRELGSDWEISPMDYEYSIEEYLILPLYLYDHSGITMNTSGFSCGWDSGQVGHIYVSHDKIREEYGDTSPESIEKATACLKGEVETYDTFIRGEVYGFEIETKVTTCEHCEDCDWEHEDSCCSFFVNNFDLDASGMSDHMDSAAYEAAKESYDNDGEWVEFEYEAVSAEK